MNSAQNATVQSPQTTGELIKYIAKRLPMRLLKTLPIILVVGFVTWLLHTYLLVFVNEGFSPDTWLANNFLNVKGGFISSNLLWGMIGALVPITISFIASGGNPAKSLSEMVKMPINIYKKNKATQNTLLPIILISCGVILLFDKLLSGVAGLVAGGIMMSAVVSFVTGRGSIFIMLFRMIFTDVQTYILKKKNKGLDSESIYMIIGSSGLVLIIFGLLKSTNIIGNIFGLFTRLLPIPAIATLFRFVFFAISFFIGSIWFILLVAGIIMLLVRSNKKVPLVPTAMIYIALFAFGMIAAQRFIGVQIFADDGGWLEAGGTWKGWIGSEGSLIAVIKGISPSVSLVGGGVLSSILGGATGGLGTAGSAPVGTGGGVQTPQTEEDAQKQHEEWVRQEREKAQREAVLARKQHEELMEKRRQEYERAKKEAELRKQREEAQKQLDEIREAKKKREEYINQLCKKYNTTPDNLRDEIRKNMNLSQAEADKWNQREKALAIAESIAQAAVVASDLAIDGLAEATGPAGRAIRAGYKITKGAATSAATDGLTVANVVGGAVSGGADAANDFIGNKYVKAGVTVVGETVGGAIKGGADGAVDGLKNGVFNAAVNAGTDKVVDKFGGKGFGNDIKSSVNSEGKTVIEASTKQGKQLWKKVTTPTAAKKFIANKQTAQAIQTGVKSVPTVANEFGVKPYAQEKGIIP